MAGQRHGRTRGSSRVASGTPTSAIAVAVASVAVLLVTAVAGPATAAGPVDPSTGSPTRSGAAAPLSKEARDARLKRQKWTSTPVTVMKVGAANPVARNASAPPVTAAALAAAYPAPASAEVPAATPTTARTTARTTAPAWRRAGSLPVSVASSAAVRVTVAPRGSADAAGVRGVLAAITPAPVTTTGSSVTSGSSGAKAGPSAAPGVIPVRVDYSGFADAYGAGYGSRLGLVSMPACALTTPSVAACRVQTRLLDSTNDQAAKTVTATLPAQTPGGKADTSDAKAARAARVVAVVANPGGPEGTFTASSLKPSGTWGVGGGTGAFTYSYPIAVPPAAAGSVAPSVALSYDSSWVDGQIAGQNNQASWVGEGWDYSPGFVERTYVSCSKDPQGVISDIYDLCWAGNIVTLSLAGHSTELVRDDTTGAWTPRDDDGTTVELKTGAANGDNNGEYWKITTPDGTAYTFGVNYGPGRTTQAATNSTWTVPVYGSRSGDPCYKGPANGGFDASVCDQGWRWNLDYVEDVHGNAALYYYTQETKNWYAAKKGATATADYVPGGVLDHIDYGLRKASGSVYASPAPQQIDFAVADRNNGASWPDTPIDQACTSGAACATQAPTFWTTKKLTTITTQVWDGAGYDIVDEYALTQAFLEPATGDDPSLQLSSVRRTGHTMSGPGGSGPATVTLPAVTFAGKQLANRVQGYNALPAMYRWRLNTITSETGEVTSVAYTNETAASGQPSTACVDSSSVPPAPESNTKLCFPVKWTLPWQTNQTLDYFQKYVTATVTSTDGVGISAGKRTFYTYLGSPAWHYDDNELVKASDRTWGQWRGYSQVEVRTGNDGPAVDPQTLTRSTYFRGMNGDTLPVGTRTGITVRDSLGASDDVADTNEFAGTVREVQTFTGGTTASPQAVGTQLTTTITDPVLKATTASRARPAPQPGQPGQLALPALTATVTGVSRTRLLQAVTSATTPTTRTLTTTYTLDALGRTLQKSETGTGIDPACTTTSYAGVTTGGLLDRVAEVRTSAAACPGDGSAPTPVVSDVRSYYDGSSTLGQLPAGGDGEVTRTDTANNAVGAPLHFAQTEATYDAVGRVKTTTAYTGTPGAVGTTTRTTTTTYTPALDGPLTQVKVTNALSQASTTVLDPRGNTTRTTNVAGQNTDAAYDGLGRLTGVWKPGQVRSGVGATAATTVYAYLVRGNAINATNAVTTTTLLDLGAAVTPASSTSPSASGTKTTTSIAQYDSFGQLRQTQSTPTNASGRVVSDAFVDSHGWVIRSNNFYLDSSTAPTTAFIAGNPDNVPSRSTTTYDGAGRPLVSKEYASTSLTTPTWSTQTVYGGDRVTVIPPTGSTTTTTISDLRGATTALWKYTANPTVSGTVVSGGAYQATTYHSSVLGQQDKITDPGGATHAWTMAYDLAGRVVSQTDPDTGTTTRTYNDTNDLTGVIDARGAGFARSYGYDALGRKTSESSGATGSTAVASWTYDTLQAGQLTSSTSYNHGDTANPYTVAATGYDGAGRSLGTAVTIPAVEGVLGGGAGGSGKTYTTTRTWTTTGLAKTTTYQAVGAIPAETTATGYTVTGQPFNLNGTAGNAADPLHGTAEYVLETGYSPFGPISSIDGFDSKKVGISYNRDEQTQRVKETVVGVTAAVNIKDDTTYTLDASGNVTRSADVRGPNQPGTAVRTMCYRYDGLVELTAAWTAVQDDPCTATPTTAAHTTVGGDHPQWQTWAFDHGQRTTQIDNAVTGGASATTTTTSTNGAITGTVATPGGNVVTTGAHLHALAKSAAVTGSTTATTYLGYDAAGNTTRRVLPNTPSVNTTTTQDLTWDADGRLDTVTATTTPASSTTTASYVYTADGTQLIRHDPTTTTLYLPDGTELTLATTGSTAGTVTGMRFYSHNGQTIVERESHYYPTFLHADLVGTTTLAIYWDSLAATRRTLDPYGNLTGTLTFGPWPDTHAYLNKPLDTTTGLTDIGARKYDTITGRFLSPDPVLDSGDPLSLPPYGYSDNNPITHSDPSGLRAIDPEDGQSPSQALRAPAAQQSQMKGGRGSSGSLSRPPLSDFYKKPGVARGTPGLASAATGPSSEAIADSFVGKSYTKDSTYVYNYYMPIGFTRDYSAQQAASIFKKDPQRLFPFPVSGCDQFTNGSTCILAPGSIGPFRLYQPLGVDIGGVGNVSVTTTATSWKFVVLPDNYDPHYFDAPGSEIEFSIEEHGKDLMLHQRAVGVSGNPTMAVLAPQGARLTWRDQSINAARMLYPDLPWDSVG